MRDDEDRITNQLSYSRLPPWRLIKNHVRMTCVIVMLGVAGAYP